MVSFRIVDEPIVVVISAGSRELARLLCYIIGTKTCRIQLTRASLPKKGSSYYGHELLSNAEVKVYGPKESKTLISVGDYIEFTPANDFGNYKFLAEVSAKAAFTNSAMLIGGDVYALHFDVTEMFRLKAESEFQDNI